MERDATHDSLTLFEAALFCFVAERDDGPAAFVRGDAGEFCVHHAVLDHAVCVAVGGDGDFDQDVVGA